MIKISALSRDLVDGHPDGGCNFYWEPGTHVVLVQEWEHRASGPVWSEVVPDPMWGDDFCDYVKKCWDNYIITDVNETYR